MKVLAVVGSRELNDHQRWAVRFFLDAIVEEYLHAYPGEVKFVSGGARGVDSIFKEVVEARCEKLTYLYFEEILPTARRWSGPGGFEERNMKIVNAATELICLQSRQSNTYGSGWTYDRAVEKLTEKKAFRFWI